MKTYFAGFLTSCGGPIPSWSQRTLLILLFACSFCTGATAAGAKGVLAQLDRSGGLAVASGEKAVFQAKELAATGRWLVHILAKSDADEARLREETQAAAGIITVSRIKDRAPFSTDTVNAALLSGGALIDYKEAERIVAPGGTVISNGEKATVAENPAYGDWTHWRANVLSTGTAEDTAMGPSNRLGWFNQGTFASHIRTANGVVASNFTIWGADNLDNGRKTMDKQRLIGRDVYSGVRLWDHGEAPSDTWNTMREQFASHPSGFIHPGAERGGPMVRTDAITGEIATTYDKGLTMGSMVQKSRGPAKLALQKTGSALVFDDTLLQGFNKEIARLDVLTGDLAWKTTVTESVARIAVSPDKQTVYVQEREAAEAGLKPRWGASPTVALSAYNAKDGTLRWRHPFGKEPSPDWTPRRYKLKHPAYPYLTALIEMDGVFYAYDQEANLGGDGASDLYAFDPKTGKLLFHHNALNKRPSRGGAFYSNNMVAWQGEFWHKGAKLPRTKTGQTDWLAITFAAGNTRCVRLSGSTDYLLLGFNSYLHKDGTITLAGLFRGNCAIPNYVGYGAVLSPADQSCGCYNGLRGQGSYLSPARARFRMVDDGERLTSPPTTAFAAHSAIPAGPLEEDMYQARPLRYVWEQRTREVQDGRTTLQMDIQRHALRASGDVTWTYRTDGRVYYAPTFSSDLVYVPSTSGTVTALDRKTGKVKWRFLAAPGYERAAVNGQLESRWPVVNTILKDGLLYVAAGRHSELDGGLWFWALDPASGQIKQQARIFLPMTELTIEEALKSSPKSPHRFRGNQPVARMSVLLGGLAVDKEGTVSIMIPRWNKKGSSASKHGYREKLGDRTGNKADLALHDPERMKHYLVPLKLAEWNGKTLDPYEAFQTDMGKSKYVRSYIWRKPAPTE